MKHQLSFASITIISDNIAEVIVDPDVEISIEMVEECYNFLNQKFPHHFALLVNKINTYNYSFEAKLSLTCHENLKAIALVCYSEQCEQSSQQILSMHTIDKWNVKVFSGYDLGWQKGLSWLEKELILSQSNDSIEIN